MSSKIFGFPLVLIVHALMILIPLVWLNYVIISNQNSGAGVESKVIVPEAVATPSATLAPTSTPKPVIKRVIPTAVLSPIN